MKKQSKTTQKMSRTKKKALTQTGNSKTKRTSKKVVDTVLKTAKKANRFTKDITKGGLEAICENYQPVNGNRAVGSLPVKEWSKESESLGFDLDEMTTDELKAEVYQSHKELKSCLVETMYEEEEEESSSSGLWWVGLGALGLALLANQK